VDYIHGKGYETSRFFATTCSLSIKPLLLVISTSDAEPPHSFEMKTTAPVVLIPTSALKVLCDL
jgi:hypothetical protein